MKKLILSASLAISSLTAFAGINWVSADSLPLLGKCIDPASAAMRYQRLPDSLEHIVKRADLFRLGRNTAGMAIRFTSDAPSVHVKWKSTGPNSMNHMTPTGTRGLDLYMMMPDSTWTFAQSARPDIFSANTEATVIQNIEPLQREYMLYLSLYDGVDSLYIGAPDGYTVSQPCVNLPRASRPILYYGTSLTQGGCANRPGMAHTNILQRRFNRDIVNLGFSGSGQLDPEIAQVMAAVPDPALFILDFLPNVTYEQLDTLINPFVDILRQAHPEVPVLIIEEPDYPYKRFDLKAAAKVEKRRALLREKVDALQKLYPGIHFLPSYGLIGFDEEATVDGLHFTDIGFLRYANALEPVITGLLNEK